MEGVQPGTTTPSQSGPGSNSNERVLHPSQIAIESRRPTFKEVLPVYKRHSQRIVSSSPRQDH